MGLRAQLAAAIAAAAALVAGCGGSGQGAEPERYVLAPSRTCFEQLAGARVDTRNLDFVATTALGGAVSVRLPANFVLVAFGQNEEEGARIEQAYRQFAGRSIPIDSVLFRSKNAVMVWNAPPSLEEEDSVLDCLRGPVSGD